LGTALKPSKNYNLTNQPEVILAIKRMHRKIGRAQQQATPLTKPLLSNYDNRVRGLKIQVLLRLGYETMRRRSELCAFKFEDICQAANKKPAIRPDFSKTDQFGTEKVLLISRELFILLAKWRALISGEGYILRSISRHGHIALSLHPTCMSIPLRALQKDLEMDPDEQPLSGHSFRVGAALDLLEQGEPLEKIMLKEGCQTESTAMKYLRNWAH
jgi:integrase